MGLLVFIPAWNEEDAIGPVVEELRAALPEADVLVVDDGSTDATAERARAAGALVAKLPFNQGVGAAVHTAYLFARRQGYSCVGRIDADGQHPPAELVRVLERVRAGEADYCVGSRWHEQGVAGDYRPSLARRIGIRLFRGLLSVTTRQRLTDVTSGLHAANQRAICLFAAHHHSDYPELELLQQALKHRLRVDELQVNMRPRAAGKSKITPLRSAYFIFKATLVLTVGSLRRAEWHHLVTAESKEPKEAAR